MAACVREIANQVGSGTLFNIGLKIPQNAIFPPFVNHVPSAIQSVDIAYHLNHRKNGTVMFDERSGTMLEGIGHYGFEPVHGARKIISVCKNPYPCDFDRGILAAMAQRFERGASVTHESNGGCRKTGGDACTYLVNW